MAIFASEKVVSFEELQLLNFFLTFIYKKNPWNTNFIFCTSVVKKF